MKKLGSFLTRTIWLSSIITLSVQADTNIEKCHKELGFKAPLIELFDNTRYRLTMQDCLAVITDNKRKAIYSVIDDNYMANNRDVDKAFRQAINQKLSATQPPAGSDSFEPLSIVEQMDKSPQILKLDTVRGYQSSVR